MHDKVAAVVYAAVDELNRGRATDGYLARDPATPLMGDRTALDSLALVTFVVAVEQKIEDAFGVSVILADDRAMSQQESPFRSIGHLVQYATMLLQEQGVS